MLRQQELDIGTLPSHSPPKAPQLTITIEKVQSDHFINNLLKA